MSAAEKIELLVDALEEVRMWISEWSPNFLEDPEWASTAQRIRLALAKARGKE